MCHATTGGLCDACHAKPKYFDGTKTHPFCSKTCATNSIMCNYCHQKRKYKEGNKIHPFCGRTCANRAKAAGLTHCHICKSVNGGCLLPGCGKPSTKGPFCSQACRSQAEGNAPSLIEVPNGHGIFVNIANQFATTWRHPTTCPTVTRVYKIIGAPASIASYKAYKASVEAQGNFSASCLAAGNESRRWHGTTRECLLGDKGETSLCLSVSCSLCGIIRTSYKLSLFGKNHKWGRFGQGIYTTSTSSKSDSYSKNVKASNQKAILLNKVVVGKGYRTTQNDSSRTAPPHGYHSVLGEVGGGCLNYDELVCYTENAIRPSYLVLYNA